MRVKVYRNLNRKEVCYSLLGVDNPHKGLVLGYAENIIISNPQLIVNQSGRNRAIKQHRRNVHAFVVGDIVGISRFQPRFNRAHINDFSAIKQWNDVHTNGTPISYNPYKACHFVEKNTGNAVGNNLKYVSIIGKDVRAIG